MADPVDPFIAARAGIDQAIAGAAEVSRLLRGHYVAHLAAGFTEDEALCLVRDFQGLLMRGEVRGNDDD